MGYDGVVGLKVFKLWVEVDLAQWFPSAGETDETGIENIVFRLFDQLILAAAVKGAVQGHSIGYLQIPQVALHRRAGDADGGGLLFTSTGLHSGATDIQTAR